MEPGLHHTLPSPTFWGKNLKGQSSVLSAWSGPHSLLPCCVGSPVRSLLLEAQAGGKAASPAFKAHVHRGGVCPSPFQSQRWGRVLGARPLPTDPPPRRSLWTISLSHPRDHLHRSEADPEEVPPSVSASQHEKSLSQAGKRDSFVRSFGWRVP